MPAHRYWLHTPINLNWQPVIQSGSSNRVVSLGRLRRSQRLSDILWRAVDRPETAGAEPPSVTAVSRTVSSLRSEHASPGGLYWAVSILNRERFNSGESRLSHSGASFRPWHMLRPLSQSGRWCFRCFQRLRLAVSQQFNISFVLSAKGHIF